MMHGGYLWWIKNNEKLGGTKLVSRMRILKICPNLWPGVKLGMMKSSWLEESMESNRVYVFLLPSVFYPPFSLSLSTRASVRFGNSVRTLAGMSNIYTYGLRKREREREEKSPSGGKQLYCVFESKINGYLHEHCQCLIAKLLLYSGNGYVGRLTRTGVIPVEK